MPDLTDVERRMLDTEGERWDREGAKDEAIRVRFKLKPIRYYQLLNQLIVTQEALAYAPVTVNRLLRLRDTRHRARHPEVA